MSDKSDINNLKNKLKKLQASVGQGGTVDTVARAKLQELSDSNKLLNNSLDKIKVGDFVSAGATGLKNILDTKAGLSSVYTKEDADSKFNTAEQVSAAISSHPSVISKADTTVVNAALNTKAGKEEVYTIDVAKATFRTAEQVTSDISNHDFQAKPNASLISKLSTKADSNNVYDKTSADSKFRTAAQVNNDITLHPAVTEKAKKEEVYTKNDADSTFTTAAQVSVVISSHPSVISKAESINVYDKVTANEKFRTAEQVTNDITNHDFNIKPNASLISKLSTKADSNNVYDKFAADSLFRTAKQVSDDITAHPSVISKAEKSTVYTIDESNTKFRTAAQVTNDITNHNFETNPNSSLSIKLSNKADSINVYDKTSADSKFSTAEQVSTAISSHPSVVSKAEKTAVYTIDESNSKFRTAAQVSLDITSHPSVISKAETSVVNSALSLKADTNSVYDKISADTKFRTSDQVSLAISSHPSVTSKAESINVYDKSAADTKFRTASQVTSDIINHDFSINSNISLNNKLSIKADTTSVYDKTTADSKFRTAAQVTTDIANHDFTAIPNTTLNTKLLAKADTTSVYNKTDADNKFRTSAQVSNDITAFDFSSANSSLTTRIKNHDFSTNTNNTLETKFSFRDTRLNTLDVHTSSINSFSSSHGYKLANIAFSVAEESSYKYASLSSVLKVLWGTQPYNPTSGYDTNKWYYTSLIPNGNADFKFSSYSYQGLQTLQLFNKITQQEQYNKEEFIGYRKRLYNIVNNAYTDQIYQDSELRLQAGQTLITNGTTDNKNPTLVVKGETNNLNGYSVDQGQLFIQDEDSDSSGFMIGYVYNAGVNEYARLQARNNNGATNININPAGGKVSIGATRAAETLNVQQGIAVTNADVNTYLYNWVGDNSNAGAIQVKAGANNTYLNGTSDYWLYLNPSGGNIRIGSVTYGNIDVVPGQNNCIRLGTSVLAWKEIWTNAGVLNSSDERIKTNIKDSEFGLEFINKLRPVSYKLKSKEKNTKTGDDGQQIVEDIPGVRPHYGFLAQQVKEAMGDKDFAGYIYDAETDVYALRYTEFISPMVKAIQELSQENDYLKSKLEEKDKQLEQILVRLAALEGE